MRRYIFKYFLAELILFTCTGLMLFSATTKADFVSNNLLDDSVFNDAGTMTAAQIDSFLNNNFPNSCISTNNGFTAPSLTGYSPSTGFTYGPDASAGTIISQAAQAYGLNPQVMLATLQKEQSLITGGSGICSSLAYTAAVGNDCPDGGSSYSYSGFELYSLHGSAITSVSGTCVNTSNAAGFSRQVVSAAWKLVFWQQHALGNYNWAVVKSGWDNSDDIGSCYYGPMTQGTFQRGSGNSCNTPTYFDGYTVIDGVSVHMDTGATAALYYYTPHFNGNQNFDNIFQSWFGATSGEGYVLATSYDDNGDPRQWVVYKGIKQLVPDPTTAKAWGLNRISPLQWSGTYLGSFPNASQPLGRLFRPDGSLDIYFVDGGNCYRVTSSAMLTAWNFNPASVQNIPVYLGRVPNNAGNLTYSVSDVNGNIFYVDRGSLRLFTSQSVLTEWEGSTSMGHQTISNDYLSMMGSAPSISGTGYSSNGQWYKISKGQVFMTTDPNVASDWGLIYAPTLIQQISPEYRPINMLTSFAMSAYPNDSRLFVVQSGNLYWLSPQQASNLGLTPNDPRMAVIPEDITPSIQTWQAVIVADTSGKAYVIDGGTKRPFSSSAVQNYWTNNGAVTPYTATNGFLNLLPTGAPIEREIIGSQPPQYDISGTTKRWIQSASSAALYAPLVQVSNSLVNVLSTGSPIP